VPEPQKINLSDPGAIKRVLDDTITKYFFEELAYVEDTDLSNVKLVLGIFSVALALTAQFYPAPFPENYHILLICCPLYFVFSTILQYIASYKEKEFILFARSKDRFNPIEVQVFTRFPKYSYDFTIGISEKGLPETKATTLTKSVGSWFDSNGIFHDNLFLDDLRGLHRKQSSGLKKD